ncbi:MAG TPA: hypothetical protein VGA61_01020 [Anaerolineae bacterium]
MPAAAPLYDTLNIKGESDRLKEKRRAGLLARPKPATEGQEEVLAETNVR